MSFEGKLKKADNLGELVHAEQVVRCLLLLQRSQEKVVKVLLFVLACTVLL